MAKDKSTPLPYGSKRVPKWLYFVTVCTGCAAVVALILAITALLSGDDSGEPKTKKFSSHLEGSISGSPDINVLLKLKDGEVTVQVSRWEGQCNGPIIYTSNSLPSDYRAVNSSNGSPITSPWTMFVSVTNNTETNSGISYVDKDGKLIFYVNSNDLAQSWNNACKINPFTMKFIKKYIGY